MPHARSASVAATLVCAMFAVNNGVSQTAPPAPGEFPLWKFDRMTTYATCGSKGRLQDKGYCESKLIDQIVAKGKSSIPILISQLTDTRRTQQPIKDFWHYTTAGDIAYFILNDLFLSSDWKTFNMPGLEALNDTTCHADSETCWRKFLRIHGRNFVQAKWLAAWNANKNRIYWDQHERCFRLSKPGAR